MSLNTWNLAHVTYDAAQRRIYLNGTWLVYQTTAHAIPVTTSPLAIGNKPGSSLPGDCFHGLMDEVRISNNARSADWIKLEYETQKANQTVVSVGATQTTAPSSLSYANNPAS
jgi:hypothetical protein